MKLLRLGLVLMPLFFFGSIEAMNGKRPRKKRTSKKNDSAKKHKNQKATLPKLCRERRLDPILDCINRGVAINTTDSNDPLKRTALHWAVYNREKALVKLLVEKKANIEAVTRLGFTPLHIAAQNGYLGICEFLVEKNADIKAETNDKATSLHFAAQVGHEGICGLLVDNDADIEAVTNDGFRPLHIAAQEGHADVCKLLLDNAADIEAVTNDGFRPQHIAAKNGHIGFCKLLLDNSADINAVTNDGFSLLHIAAWNGHIEFCKFLVKEGAAINGETNNGFTPMYIAYQNGHEEICDFLSKKGAVISIILNDEEIIGDTADSGTLENTNEKNPTTESVPVLNNGSTNELTDALNQGDWDTVRSLVKKKEFSKENLKNALDAAYIAERYDIVAILASLLKKMKLNGVEPVTKKVHYKF